MWVSYIQLNQNYLKIEKEGAECLWPHVCVMNPASFLVLLFFNGLITVIWYFIDIKLKKKNYIFFPHWKDTQVILRLRGR